MPFTVQQNTFIVMAYFRSAEYNEDGTWTYSIRSCLHQFLKEYPDVKITVDAFSRHRKRLIERFMETGSVLKRKPKVEPTVLTKDVIEDIKQQLIDFPKKSVRQLSIQIGISYGSAHRAVKMIKEAKSVPS